MPTAGAPRDMLSIEALAIPARRRNRALIDGNKRLALEAAIAVDRLNGRRLKLTNGQAYDLVMKVAADELDQVEEISAVLQGTTAPRQ
jgi:death on curing protein